MSDVSKKQYTVSGMGCAACVNRVEKAVSEVSGVDSVSVNLINNMMLVTGNCEEGAVETAVKNAGYEATELKGKDEALPDSGLAEKKTLTEHSSLWISILLFLPLIYISMGYSMWGFYLPKLLAENTLILLIIQAALSLLIMVVNRKIFIRGYMGVVNRAPNMDTLVAMGAGVSFLFSTYIVVSHFLNPNSVHGGSIDMLLHGVYFESAGGILVFIAFGKFLEELSKSKMGNAIERLRNLAPDITHIVKDGKEEDILTKQVVLGDIFVVRPGEFIPIDGIIIEGSTSINESTLTGESLPVDKDADSEVFAGTVNLTGFIKARVTKTGEETALGKIISHVLEAAVTKAPIARIADKISGIFVPIVIAVSIVTFIIWFAILGRPVEYSLIKAVSVLVISCPCALGLATPVSIMVGNSLGAKNSILYKNSEMLEEAGKVNTVIFDKTGTLTKGEMMVTDIIPIDIEEKELLSIVYSLESKSEHPLGKGIVNYIKKLNEGVNEKIQDCNISDFKALTGSGVVGVYNGSKVAGGSGSYISKSCTIAKEIEDKQEELSKNGKTPLLFTKENKLIGIIALADEIKEEAAEVVKRLKTMGIETLMLTGDNYITAKSIADKVGVDSFKAALSPESKAEIIGEYKKKGKVAMVGDGINDAIALATADISIAIGTGTDIAIESAGIILMGYSLKQVLYAINLSKKTLINIKENLFWAFIYNVIGIPLAAGAYVRFGLELNPMFAAFAMSLSSLCVTGNALRLNLANIRGEN